MSIYSSGRININYNVQAARAEIESDTHVPLTSIALFQLQDKASCFDLVKAFVLKKLTFTWIVVKDKQGNKSKEIINITSIAKHTGLSVKNIKAANKAGNLYEAIENAICPADDTPPQVGIPSQAKIDALHDKKAHAILDQGYQIDESDIGSFLNSVEAFFSGINSNISPTPLRGIDKRHLGVIFADYAFNFFSDLTSAKGWIDAALTDNRFAMVNSMDRMQIIINAHIDLEQLYI